MTNAMTDLGITEKQVTLLSALRDVAVLRSRRMTLRPGIAPARDVSLEEDFPENGLWGRSHYFDTLTITGVDNDGQSHTIRCEVVSLKQIRSIRALLKSQE